MKSNKQTSRPSILLLSFFLSLVLSFNTAYASSSETNNLSSEQSININLADAQTIAKKLKGIGLKKAEAIVDYRERYGEFAHLDELKAVKGIGQSTLNKNAHLLTLE